MADLAYREVCGMSRIQTRLRLVTTYDATGSMREPGDRDGLFRVLKRALNRSLP